MPQDPIEFCRRTANQEAQRCGNRVQLEDDTGALLDPLAVTLETAAGAAVGTAGNPLRVDPTGGTAQPVVIETAEAAQYAFANVAAAQTDSAIVAAVVGRRIRVLALVAVCGATATTITFNSKPGGAGTAISCLFANGANGGEVLPFNPVGWFQTGIGEGLAATTGAGSATGVQVVYAEV